MQEIHHRIKNNLQVISSFLGIQKRELKQQEAIAALEQSQARIQTISLLHEQLYNQKGLENVGLEFRPELVLEIHEKDYKKYESLFIPFIKDNEIDAIITTGESAAVASMKASLKNGYEIPKDIAVIAFSNGILARHSSPKMTTISQHGEIMGEKAASILIDRLKNKNTELVTEVIKTDLVIRDSTRR